MTSNIVWDAVPPPTTEDTGEAVVGKNVKTTLIFYEQRSGFTAVKHESPDH